MATHVYAEILTIGDEILYGQITDTNSQWIGEQLSALGIKVRRKSSVGDEAGEILDGLRQAAARADIILITGGLGPTKDDITKKTLATYFGTGMRFHQQVFDHIAELFKSRGRTELLELNRMQAEIPANAEVIHNAVGTAPGMWMEQDGKVFVSMPGVPYEMKAMMQASILPRLRSHFQTPVIYHHSLKTVGLPESKLAHMIEEWEDHLPSFIKLAYLPRLGQVRLRLTATGDDLDRLRQACEAEAAKILPILGHHVYAQEDIELDIVIGRLLKAKGMTMAVAESCTGGFVAQQITATPGCSAYFKGSVVAYANELKQHFLGVRAEDLQTQGAVSEVVARQMAESIRLQTGADYGLATTGIAGPDGGTPEKPVGTVWIACAHAEGTDTRLLTLSRERSLNIQLTYSAVMHMLYRKIVQAG